MSDIVASGVYYHDPKDGVRKWMTGDMLLAQLRAEVGKKVGMKTIEQLVEKVVDRLNKLQTENDHLHNRLVLAEEALKLPIRSLFDGRDEVLQAAKAARDRQRKAVAEPPPLRSIK